MPIIFLSFKGKPPLSLLFIWKFVKILNKILVCNDFHPIEKLLKHENKKPFKYIKYANGGYNNFKQKGTMCTYMYAHTAVDQEECNKT